MKTIFIAVEFIELLNKFNRYNLIKWKVFTAFFLNYNIAYFKENAS